MRTKDVFCRRRILTACFLYLLLPAFAGAQQAQVTGVVRDQRGDPMPSVSVMLKNGKTGTKTGEDGKYRLTSSPNDVIIFSFAGFTTREIPVKGLSVIDAVLYPAESTLDDVVVVGYGTMKRGDLTGATSSIQGGELRKIPVATPAEAITGKLAGVKVQTTDGQPGADILINIRGGTSISQDNSPLYIVDGFPSDGGLISISPQDIESINILKDASSTAIYGARGANGVVLITTRSGKEGPGVVSYDGYAGIKKLGNKLDVLTPYEYVLYQYERTRSSVASQDKFLQAYGTWDNLSNYKNVKGVDWQEEAFGRNAYHQSHNLAVTGGNKSTKYRISYSRDDEEGLLVGNSYGRNYFKLKLDQKVTDRLSFSTNVSYSQSEIKGAGTAGSQDNALLRNAIMYRPVNGMGSTIEDLENLDYDPDLSLSKLTTEAAAKQRLKDKRNTVFNLSMDYKILKGLTLRMLGGISLNDNRNESFDTHLSSSTISKGGPFGGIELQSAGKYNNTNLLIYERVIKKKHQINAMVGQEYVYNKVKSVGAYASMYDSDDIGINNLSFGNEYPKPNSGVEKDKLLSYFGRVFYSYDGKYLLTGTLRADGSSKFIQANRWGYFPSLAVAWQASKEDFIRDLNVFSDLKLRLSYGAAGNNRIPNNLYGSTFNPVAYAADGTSLSVALIPGSLANPNLKWEATYSRNLGIDMGFFRNRITANIDMYHNTTNDLLLESNIPTSSGYLTQFKNVGSTMSEGVEITLSSTNIQTSKFNWTTDFNISFFKTIVTGLNNDGGFKQESALYPSNYAINIYDYLVKVGEPVGLIYGYITDGFYGVDDFNYNPATQTYTLKDGIPAMNRATTQPGDIRFKDLGGVKDDAGNPMLTDDDDRTILGRATPKFFGGFNNSFSYKGFDLSVFVNFSVGNKILNANKIIFTTAYHDYMNVLGLERSRWTNINANGEVVKDPDELKELNKNATKWRYQDGLPRFTHSWAVEDGSFLRINNITLGYTLPRTLMQKARIKSLRVYATAYNVYTLTNYSGYDPEISTRRALPFTPGVDHGGYPKSFSLVGGLNISF